MTESSATQLTDEQVRLPTTVIPSKYQVEITPNLETESFSGWVNVTIEVREAVNVLTLNSADLEISHASLSGSTLDDPIKLEINLQPELERVEFKSSATIQPGSYTLRCEFAAQLNANMRGFYKSTFTAPDGTTQTLATSQCQATDCRRVFPCWDEPAFKAVFSLVMTVPNELVAISNGAIINEVPEGSSLKRVTFADTIPMSTYLVALYVGPFEFSETVLVDGVPIRVATTPGKKHLTGTALDIGASALKYFIDWFGCPYPTTKMDLIAVPDFEAGAMENLGCIIFRETALLADPAQASRTELELIADVVAHEIAHMWFGDLVTMEWWEGIWLNEAFATFCEVLAVDNWKPEWKRWVTACLSKGAAMAVDGLSSTRPIEYPVRLPSDTQAMFDVITYEKGGAVLRMLQQYLGDERFQAGIQLYMSKHAYKNTKTTDLWDAIEEATGEPVRAMSDSWIFQPGHPLVSGEVNGNTMTLTQRRFAYLPDEQVGEAAEQRWHVPVVIRGEADGKEFSQKVLLTENKAEVELPSNTEFSVVNSDGTGVFRSRVSDQMMAQQIANYSRLRAGERFNLAADTWAAVLSGQAPVAQQIQLLPLLAQENDPSVWAALSAPLDVLLRTEGTDTAALQSIIATHTSALLDQIGREPQEGEAERQRSLRGLALSTLGLLAEDAKTLEWANQSRQSFLKDRQSVPADLIATVTLIAAEHGNVESYDQSLALVLNPTTPQDVTRELGALARYNDPALLKRTLGILIGPEVRAQDTPMGLVTILGNHRNSGPAWDEVSARWPEVRNKLSAMSLARVLSTLSLLPPDRADHAQEFLTENSFGEATLMIRQAMERLRVNTKFRLTQGPAINSALAHSKA